MYEQARQPRLKTVHRTQVVSMPLLLLVLPLLEIAGFVVVGSQIGVLATLGLVLASGVLGAALLRSQSRGALARAQTELRAGRDPSPHLAGAAATAVAGILLIVPGFLTDIVGLLLLVPAVRAFLWRSAKGRVIMSGRFAAFRGGFGSTRWSGERNAGDNAVIDLDAADFSRTAGPDSPWRLERRD